MSGQSTRSGAEFTSPNSTRNGLPSSRPGSSSSRSSRQGRRRGDPPSALRNGNGRQSPTQSAGRSRTPKSPHSAAGTSPAYHFPNSPAGSKGTASPASYRFPNTPSSRGARTPNRQSARDIDLRSPLNYLSPLSSKSGGGGGGSGRTPSTPIRHRPDINANRHMREIDLGAGGGDEPQLVIWGTSVSATEFKEKFRRFLETFKVLDAAEDEVDDEFDFDQPLYIQKLHEIKMLEEPFLNLNCEHLRNFDPEMHRQLLCYPQEVIPTMDMTVNEVFNFIFPEQALAHQIQVRPFNADKTKTMRYLNPDDMDQLVSFSGMVIRVSNIMPEMREAYFKCSVCSDSATSEMDRGKFIEPTLCPKCNTPFTFTLIHNRSDFVDRQMIRLQEDLDDTPVGETPYMAALFAHGNLVNSVQPGDRITITGIYRSAPLRINPGMRNLRTVYKTHVDVVHFRKLDTKRLREVGDGTGLQIPPERIDFIKELSRKPDIYERLARAIAPSIYEHEDVKKGILLQLFGGTKKDFKDTGRGRFRAEVNILLCGDPGTSKSQLLKYVFDLIPRSQYTSGKGSSAVGLTAYITKDPETRQIVLQTGALVLADNGVCCIDEFDKMSESTRSILHEVMEQQTLSIAKAGIICQLNARTSVLAAANPVESQWNIKKTIVQNINLPHTLLSRFDLIFLITDPANDIYDRRLGRHMISLYFQKQEEADKDQLDMSVLRDYIAYAKEMIHPRLTPLASQRLIEAYVRMRQAGVSAGVISAFPRQLESLIRLSEAHAKIRLSEHVEVVDVEEAVRIHREAIKASCTDPKTGLIDASILTTGVSNTERKRKKEIGNALKKILETRHKNTNVSKQKLLMEIKDQSSLMITKEMFDEILEELHDEGSITLTGSGKSTVRLSSL